MQRMQLSREDFDNPEVAGAVNPTPTTVTSRSHPEPKPHLRAHTRPPHTCDHRGQRECPNSWFKTMRHRSQWQPNVWPARLLDSLRRHIRNAHPGATLNPFRTNIPQAERIAGENALKRWILSRGWRTARYVKEPGEGPMYSIIQDYCNFTRAAGEDNDFAQQFGTEFHRPRLGKRKSPPLPSKPPTPPSAPKRKRAPPKKGHKATGSRKQPARAKKDAAESVPETRRAYARLVLEINYGV
ncbi:uncharacterized protein ATNIH1004_010451 [Aspergillus tanneri]|uniref:Uncharacterized protein n=1 Tax=Aspergillus tanneri TaxID=1220188 RepID=A0A5M9MLN7_9EURO|nr:uncharacterized protein ATNIH1004_010451 [Aspergillus tanneri]KAA8643677.1 hypothetical protein ATNIH1004_010451 [Aspergillus tanneri]